MRESSAEIEALQQLLDRSNADAGEHLKSIFGNERMSATELVSKLDGIFEMHLATLAGDGSPLVAPIDGIFLRGKVFFGVPAKAVRSKLLRRDQRVSASYTDGSFGMIVHGTAIRLDDTDDAALEFEAVCKELYVALYGPGWLTFYEHQKKANAEAGIEGFAGYIEPRVMFAKR